MIFNLKLTNIIEHIYYFVKRFHRTNKLFWSTKNEFLKIHFSRSSIISKCLNFFSFDWHQIINIWWTSKHFKNSEMFQNFSIPKVETIWELSQFDSSNRLRMFYFSKYLNLELWTSSKVICPLSLYTFKIYNEHLPFLNTCLEMYFRSFILTTFAEKKFLSKKINRKYVQNLLMNI